MSDATNTSIKTHKAAVLGKSAATGRYVMAPLVTKKSTISDNQIRAAIKSVIAKKK